MSSINFFDPEPKTRLARAVRRLLTGTRPPDEVIGPEVDPYLRRWHVRKTGGRHTWGVYLHHFCRSDDDRALHDHRYASASLILEGQYIEHTPGPDFDLKDGFDGGDGIDARYDSASTRSRRYGVGSLIRRPNAAAPHRIELVDGRPCWTLFVIGVPVRDWGFYCPRGWTPWREYTRQTPGGNEMGKGCE